MHKCTKLIFKFLIAIMLIFNVSCQKEELKQDKKYSVTNQIHKPPLHSIKFHNSSSLKTIVSTNTGLKTKLQNFSLPNTSNRTVESLNYGFSIDTTRAQHIQTASYNSYTFVVERNSQDSSILENYMYTEFNTGNHKQYLIAYPIIITDNNTVSYDIDNASIQVIDDVSLLSRNNETINCIKSVSYQEPICVEYDCNDHGGNGNGQHSGGVACENGSIQSGYNCTPGGWIEEEDCSGSSGGSGNPRVLEPYDVPDGTPGIPTDNTPTNTPEEVMLLPFLEVTLAYEIENCINSGSDSNIPDNTTIPQGTISSLNLSQVILSQMFNYLNQNNCSEEAQEFTKLAIEAFEDGDEVDFEEKIINKLTGKAKCIYAKIKVQNTVRKALNRFQDVNSPAKLKLESVSLGESFGNTIAPDENDLIKVQLNTDNGFWGVDFQPNVLVAQTLFHEIIHAEFYRQLVHAVGEGNYTQITVGELHQALINKKLYTLYEHVRRHRDWSHNFMANHYRDTIARVIQEYATGIAVSDSQQPQQLYMNLAWRGLRIDNQIEAWDNLSISQQEAINNIIDNYTINNSNQNCNAQ